MKYMITSVLACTLLLTSCKSEPKEEKNAFSPTELLLSGIVACAAVDIVSMIKKRRKTFVDMKAETQGDRKENHPRGFKDIDLKYIVTSPDLTEEELAKIIDLAVRLR